MRTWKQISLMLVIGLVLSLSFTGCAMQGKSLQSDLSPSGGSGGAPGGGDFGGSGSGKGGSGDFGGNSPKGGDSGDFGGNKGADSGNSDFGGSGSKGGDFGDNSPKGSDSFGGDKSGKDNNSPFGDFGDKGDKGNKDQGGFGNDVFDKGDKKGSHGDKNDNNMNDKKNDNDNKDTNKNDNSNTNTNLNKNDNKNYNTNNNYNNYNNYNNNRGGVRGGHVRHTRGWRQGGYFYEPGYWGPIGRANCNQNHVHWCSKNDVPSDEACPDDFKYSCICFDDGSCKTKRWTNWCNACEIDHVVSVKEDYECAETC